MTVPIPSTNTSENLFRLLVEQSPVATCLFVGREMRIDIANDAMLAFFGKGKAILGKPIGAVLGDPDDPAIRLLTQVFTTGESFEAKGAPAQLVIKGVAGTYYFDFSLQPFRTATGEVYAIMETAVDVTEQVIAQKALEASEARYRALAVELEAQVQTRTQQLQISVEELKRSNQNLEQFAYIASHDLQEPLRKIQSFSDLLQTQYGHQLGAGIDYALRMQLAARRMSNLIKDLLTYSRISTRQEAITPVALTNVMQAVLTDLDVTIQETNAQVSVDALPVVSGDASQLGQLFQNLLSNALKFHPPGVAPVVRVQAQVVLASDLPPSVKPSRLVPAYQRIDVTDNGIGFDEKHTDRIFQVFHRLHGKKEFPGTGIGLAICEKVVTNHGGSITARSQPGQGATFSVFLPA